jgi:hypothetical protein
MYIVLYCDVVSTLERVCCNNKHTNLIGGVMVGMLASSVVYRRFEPLSGQNKDI